MTHITQQASGRGASGFTSIGYGDNWFASGTESAAASETSLFVPVNGSATGPIDVSKYHEAILLVNATAVSGTSPSYVVKVYACDSQGARYTALVTRTITGTGASRDIIPVPGGSPPGPAGPLGNFIEVTTTLTGTSPSVTATIELQLKT